MAFKIKEWRPYLRKGADNMVENSITGIGNMPPMGTCFECDEEDFRNLIDYMSLRKK